MAPGTSVSLSGKGDGGWGAARSSPLSGIGHMACAACRCAAPIHARNTRSPGLSSISLHHVIVAGAMSRAARRKRGDGITSSANVRRPNFNRCNTFPTADDLGQSGTGRYGSCVRTTCWRLARTYPSPRRSPRSWRPPTTALRRASHRGYRRGLTPLRRHASPAAAWASSA